MSAASQGSFVVIPEISHGDISCIIKKSALRQSADRLDKIRGLLVYEVVQPIGEQQIRARPPGAGRRFRVVIPREIIPGQLNRESFVFVSQIFVTQSIRIIFGMSGDEDLPAVIRRNRVNSGFLALRENLERRTLSYVFLDDSRMARMRYQKIVVKTAEQD